MAVLLEVIGEYHTNVRNNSVDKGIKEPLMPAIRGSLDGLGVNVIGIARTTNRHEDLVDFAVEDVYGQGKHDFCAADQAADACGFR